MKFQLQVKTFLANQNAWSIFGVWEDLQLKMSKATVLTFDRLAVSSILMHMQSTRTSTNSVPSYSLAHSCSFTFVVKYRTSFLILRLILFLDLDLELDLLNKLVLVLHALLWCKLVSVYTCRHVVYSYCCAFFICRLLSHTTIFTTLHHYYHCLNILLLYI